MVLTEYSSFTSIQGILGKVIMCLGLGQSNDSIKYQNQIMKVWTKREKWIVECLNSKQYKVRKNHEQWMFKCPAPLDVQTFLWGMFKEQKFYKYLRLILYKRRYALSLSPSL